jgi:hypothetical protein
MNVRKVSFWVCTALLASCAGCRLSKDQVVGRYSYVPPAGSAVLALELSDDGTFTVYRSIHWGSRDLSGSGTWKLINSTIVGPGVEAVYLKSDQFMMALSLSSKDGKVCVEVDKNDELWCKSE